MNRARCFKSAAYYLLLTACCLPLIARAEVLVNDDTHGGIPQLNPDIAYFADGRFMIAWEDYRDGDFDSDISCQIFDSLGRPVDTNYVISEDTVSRNIWNYRQTLPALAASELGRAAACWQDYRRGYSHIYFQRLDSLGRPLGGNQAVAPNLPTPGADTLSETQPDIAALDSGYVLVWTQQLDSTGRTTIWGAEIDARGKMVRDFRIADNPKSEWCADPAVAACASGFVAVWDQSSSEKAVRRRWFDCTGTARGPSVKLPFHNAERPRVACDCDGNGLVVWHQTPIARVWAQAFDTTGQTPGPVFILSDDTTGWSANPCLAYNADDEHFLAAWEDGRNGEVRIYGQLLDRYGSMLGHNLRLDSAPHLARQGLPAVGIRSAGHLAAAWVDTREGDQNIYGTCRGIVMRSFRVNSDRASALQDYPVITQDSLGNSSVFWFDYRNNQYAPDIYGQRFDRSFRRLGGNFRVNDAPPGRPATFFWAATNRAGQTAVAWEDARSGNPDIYAQVYNPDGTALGANFSVNDNAGNSDQGWPFLTVNDSGAYVVVWTDTRNGGLTIFAQNFDAAGRRFGNNWPIDAGSWEPSVWLSNQGDFWIAWRNPTAVKARHFRAPLQALSPEVIVTDTAGPAIAAPKITVTPSGTVWIIWMDARRGKWDVFAQRLNPSGTRAGGNFRVNDDKAICDHFLPSVSNDGGDRVFVTWSDFRVAGNLDVRAQVFDTGGAALDTNFIANTDPWPPVQQWAYGSVAARGPQVVYAWLDNRNRRSWDVYARAAGDTDRAHFDWRDLIITPSITARTCRVRPSLATSGQARLKVFDALGRQVRHISTAGPSPILLELDCRDLPSGVYLARLETRGMIFQGRFTVLR